MEKYKIILYTSYIVCLFSIVVFLIGYQNLPEIVPIHQNLKGEIDDWGSKITLFILPVLSIVILLSISFLIKRPSMLNYPVEITEENKNTLYLKMQLFISLLSFFLSALFLALIMESMNVFSLKYDITFFSIYGVIFSLIPIIIIKYFRR